MAHIKPMVIDISHHNTVAPNGFETLKGAGYVGVILKATQGTGFVDATYAVRKIMAKNAGLLCGAYHFNTGDNVASQVEHFFGIAKPDDRMMMALDFEDNDASNMTLAQAIEFLQRGDEKLGRPLWIYTGNRLKETITRATEAEREFIGRHPLWCCQYGPTLKLVDANGRRLPWSRASLWQFTGDGIGPAPHNVPGIVGNGIDINSYDGTPEQLAAEWTGGGVIISPDAPTAPASMPTLIKGDSGAAVIELQRRLIAKTGLAIAVDGKFGPGTDGAVRSFQSRQGLKVDGIVGAKTWAALTP